MATRRKMILIKSSLLHTQGIYQKGGFLHSLKHIHVKLMISTNKSHVDSFPYII